MVTRAQIKKQVQKFLEHFEYSDIFGLSALIFGLVLSNPSIDEKRMTESPDHGPKKEEAQKHKSQRKKALHLGPRRLKKVAGGRKNASDDL